jgi:hypothetical protein
VSGHEDETGRAREDAAWQDIVDGYGERPEFPDVPAPEPSSRVDPTPVFEVPLELGAASWEDEGHFVPEPPPPVPRLSGPRGVAWAILVGTPILGLVLALLRVGEHLGDGPFGGFLIFLLAAGFVGSFGYLVATMDGPDDPDSGWDDGAVL